MPTPNQGKLKIETVSLDAIRTDGDTQTRSGLDDATLERYTEAMNNGDVFGPIVVFRDDSGILWLVDGFHRLNVCRRRGDVDIQADVRLGSQRDAMLFAFGANNTHGLPRTREDNRRTIARMLQDEEWGQWSDRRIAAFCCVSHTTVAKVRNEMKQPNSILSGQIGQIESPVNAPEASGDTISPIPETSEGNLSGQSDQIDQPTTRTVQRGEQVYEMKVNVGSKSESASTGTCATLEEPDIAPETSGSVILAIPEPAETNTTIPNEIEPPMSATPSEPTRVETSAQRTAATANKPTPTTPTQAHERIVRAPLSALEQLKLAWKKYSQSERQEIWVWLRQEMLGE